MYTLAFNIGLVICASYANRAKDYQSAIIIAGQTYIAYAIQIVTDFDPLKLAMFYLVTAITFLFMGTGKYANYLGIVSAMICLVHVAGVTGELSVERGLGIYGLTVWNIGTFLCWLQLFLLGAQCLDSDYSSRHG